MTPRISEAELAGASIVGPQNASGVGDGTSGWVYAFANGTEAVEVAYSDIPGPWTYHVEGRMVGGKPAITRLTIATRDPEKPGAITREAVRRTPTGTILGRVKSALRAKWNDKVTDPRPSPHPVGEGRPVLASRTLRAGRMVRRRRRTDRPSPSAGHPRPVGSQRDHRQPLAHPVPANSAICRTTRSHRLPADPSGTTTSPQLGSLRSRSSRKCSGRVWLVHPTRPRLGVKSGKSSTARFSAPQRRLGGSVPRSSSTPWPKWPNTAPTSRSNQQRSTSTPCSRRPLSKGNHGLWLPGPKEPDAGPGGLSAAAFTLDP